MEKISVFFILITVFVPRGAWGTLPDSNRALKPVCEQAYEKEGWIKKGVKTGAVGGLVYIGWAGLRPKSDRCRFLIYDNTHMDEINGWFWIGYGQVTDYMSKDTLGVPASSWQGAWDTLGYTYVKEDCDCIQEIEIWSHGDSGRVIINKEDLDLGPMTSYVSNIEWVTKHWCDHNDGIYFRSCAVAQGNTGQGFMRRATTVFKAKVRAHTHDLGINQPGLVSLLPDQDPYWSADTGKDSYVDSKGWVHETGFEQARKAGELWKYHE